MKFKKSLLNIVQKEDGQMALILAFVFLAVLGTIGISFLYRMRLEDRAVSNPRSPVLFHQKERTFH